MKKNELVHVWQTDNHPEKLFIEGILEGEGIEFEVEKPQFKAQSLYQEQGPWDFYVESEKQREVEKLLTMLIPTENEVTGQPEEKKLDAKKAWAWMVIVLAASMISLLIYMFAKL